MCLVCDPEGPSSPPSVTSPSDASGWLGTWNWTDLAAHFGDCSTCRAALAKALERAPCASAGHLERRASPGIGEVIAGKYRIDGVLGQGGMGIVLSAVHIDLGLQVAIKSLHRPTRVATARFLQEARLAAQLQHEYIVRVFDYGHLPDGAPFLVMERLAGVDLAHAIAQGRLPVPVALQYVIEACEALEVAHAAGVVHRDLKPENLFVTTHLNGRTHIKVLDFGISKCLQSNPGGANDLTASGAVMGSPQYMSPEQVMASKEVDARTDIWSLGAILYELLSGEKPFAAASAWAIAVKIATGTAKSLSGVSPAVRAIVFRCLEKAPAARFSSVSELARALRTHGEHATTARASFSKSWTRDYCASHGRTRKPSRYAQLYHRAFGRRRA